MAALLINKAENNKNTSTTYHVLTDGRWEVRVTPPCCGIKKAKPLSLGFYAKAADATAASIEFYQNCPALKNIHGGYIEYKLRCENIALRMQVASLLHDAKTRCSELVKLRKHVCDLVDGGKYESSLAAGVTDRSIEREQRRQMRENDAAAVFIDTSDIFSRGC
tara:strand:+ start:2810 stop:3301 length:492 start_codon:yes stop_codon:yes gene_type:complete